MLELSRLLDPWLFTYTHMLCMYVHTAVEPFPPGVVGTEQMLEYLSSGRP